MLSLRWIASFPFLLCLGNLIQEHYIPAECFMQVKDGPHGMLFGCWPNDQPCVNCEVSGLCKQLGEEGAFFIFFECTCYNSETLDRAGAPCDTLLFYDLETEEVTWDCFPNCCPAEEPVCPEPPNPIPPMPNWTSTCNCQ